MRLIVWDRCAAEILDDSIPVCRQDGDMFVGVRETKKAKALSVPWL
jgi:hypothetical protein